MLCMLVSEARCEACASLLVRFGFAEGEEIEWNEWQICPCCGCDQDDEAQGDIWVKEIGSG
mgnify:FL=1